MKKLIAVFLLTIGLASCESGEKAKQFELSGKVENPSEEGIITLGKIENGRLQMQDTIQLNESNEFSITKESSSPGFYIMNFYNKQQASLILGEEDVNIVVDGSQNNGKVEITGSKDNENLQELKELADQQREDFKKINMEFLEARKAGDEEKMKNINDDFQIEQENRIANLKSKVKEMLPSIAVLQAMNMLNPNEEYEFMREVSEKLYEKYPESAMVNQFRDQMIDLGKVAVGAEAPDFTMPTAEGDTVSLSDFRGNYVLVDFWAAWCKPCRQENPNVVAAYNKFKDKGFEVLGVSLDKKKEDWLAAIEQDNLDWTQVSELKYWQTPVVKEYSISGIPFSLLIDPEGKIVAKNLRGEALHEKLAEIYPGS